MAIMPSKWIWGISVLVGCTCIAGPLHVIFSGGINQIKYDRFTNPEQDLNLFQPLNNTLFFFYVGVDSAVGMGGFVFLIVSVMDFLDDMFQDPNSPIQSTKKFGATIRKNPSPFCSVIASIVLIFVYFIGLVVIIHMEQTRQTRIKIPEEMPEFQQRDIMICWAAGFLLAAMVLTVSFFCWIPAWMYLKTKINILKGEGGANHGKSNSDSAQGGSLA
ncbi:OLC1v1000129C1 [Oldenlandia corymbosa var. corymbosa]|uniref:OLC1v1000129C1 n=1 Tax=Oldenlandia corymbosa var. corymbosa TaxID=529605 RepID=A0AAV1D495_OLDCO|nr:OLC1v1000129C1 [Oldenlandia corymbosa var. corymbosa]